MSPDLGANSIVLRLRLTGSAVQPLYCALCSWMLPSPARAGYRRTTKAVKIALCEFLGFADQAPSPVYNLMESKGDEFILGILSMKFLVVDQKAVGSLHSGATGLSRVGLLQ